MHEKGYKVINLNKIFIDKLKLFVKKKFSKTEIEKIYNDSYFKKKYSTKLARSFSSEIDVMANNEAYIIARKYFNLSGVIPFVDKSYFKEVGYPKLDFFYRVVRKNKTSDIGYAHTDKAFWEIAKKTRVTPPFSSCKKRVKIWIPLFGCDKENSLIMYEGSHREKNNYKIIRRKNENRLRPAIISKKKYKKVVPVKSDLTYKAVMFDDNLIHEGQLNQTSKLRVSAEFHVIME